MMRPRGVTIIGCLLIVEGLVLGVSVGSAILAGGMTPDQQVIRSIGAVPAGGWIGVGAYAIVATLMLAGGVALLMMLPWSWTVAMLLQGYALTLNLWSYFNDHPLYLQMLIAVVIVFYLNSRDVYGALRASPHS
jgi:hypothetical protein